MDITVSKSVISKRVDEELRSLGVSVRTCCERFNSTYEEEIREKRIKPLKKDFVQRVRKNKFATTSVRVLKLCEFLKIDLHDNNLSEFKISEEAEILEQLVTSRPELKPLLKTLITGISELSQGIQ